MNFLPVNYNHLKKRSRCQPAQIRSAWAWKRFQAAARYRQIQGDGRPWQLRGFVAAHLKLLTSVSLASGHGKRTPSRKIRLQKPDVVKGNKTRNIPSGFDVRPFRGLRCSWSLTFYEVQLWKEVKPHILMHIAQKSAFNHEGACCNKTWNHHLL